MEKPVKSVKMFIGQSFLVNSDLKLPQKASEERKLNQVNLPGQEFYPKSKQLHKQ